VTVFKARCTEVSSYLNPDGETIHSATLEVDGFDEDVTVYFEKPETGPAVGKFYNLTLTPAKE
jgi:hypothetical protein